MLNLFLITVSFVDITGNINKYICASCWGEKKPVRHTFQSTRSATTQNHCHLPQSLSPRVLTPSGLWFCVAALCGRQSTRSLINRLELLTGGSSIPHRPCHFHYCISITPHFRDKARKRRWAGQKTSFSLAF